MRPLAASALLLPLLAAQLPASNEVRGINLATDGKATTVTVELTGDFDFVTANLHEPERVYFDIPMSQPRIDSRAYYSKVFDNPLVKRVRVAETAPEVTRVVLDLSQPAEVSASKRPEPPQLRILLRAAAEEAGGIPAPQNPPAAPPVPPAPDIRIPTVQIPAAPDNEEGLSYERLILAIWTMVAAVAALAVFTAFLAWETRRLRVASDRALRMITETMRSQAEDLKEALAIAERHAAVSETTAEAAKMAAEATARTSAHLIVGQRAWIVASPPRIPLTELRKLEELASQQASGVLQIPVLVTNRGRNVAYIRLAKANMVILPQNQDLPAEPGYESPTATAIRGRIALPPDTPYQLLAPSLEFPFTEIRTGLARLWLYGFAEYQDSTDEQHRTSFCFVYRHRSPPAIPSQFYIAGPESYNSFT